MKERASNDERTSREILLVGEYQQQAIFHLAIRQYPMQLVLRLVNSVSVLAVDNKDETLGSRVIVTPEWSNLVLAPNIPNVEFDVLIGDSFDIESNCNKDTI